MSEALPVIIGVAVLLVLIVRHQARSAGAAKPRKEPPPHSENRSAAPNGTRHASTGRPGHAAVGPTSVKVSSSLDSFRLTPLMDIPPSPPTSRSAPASAAIGAWVPRDTAVTVASTRITGGMIYVGKELPSPARYGADKCLIDPSLPVAKSIRQGEVLGLNYWPEYSGLTPSGRRAYIDWLAGGRQDPKADIGLIFLFFYGLERRLFHDRQLDDVGGLVAEVGRLLTIYGDNHSFRSYATNFLSAAALLSGGAPARVEPAPVAGYITEIPFATRIHLGNILAEGSPLSADDALLWVLGTPETRLRTPGSRCFPELRKLFGIAFQTKHPRGLRLSAPKRRISATYAAASGTFSAEIPGPHATLPDISALSAPLTGLRAMLEEAQTGLEAFSRLLGRKPDARGTLQAAMLLPAPIQAEACREALAPARARVSALLRGGEMGTVPIRHLLTALDLPEPTTVSVSSAIHNQAGRLLDLLGYGMEPDRRHGGAAVLADAEIAVFAAESGAPVDPLRGAFVAAKAAMEVAMLAAVADGDLSAEEFATMRSDARGMGGLEPAEKVRLEAFVWTLKDRAKAGNALKRAAAMPAAARHAIAAAAVSAVLADGQASPREIAFLERVHRTLGLPPEAVHSALHKGASPGRVGDYPGSLVENGAAISFDAQRLERIRHETSAVSALLSGIFADDAAETAPVPLQSPTEADRHHFDGLDAAHGKLLILVLSSGGMTLPDFEVAARSSGLMAEGALETINDWGFERFGDVIIDTELSQLEVAEHCRKELQVEAAL